ncbi:hypothetical protein C5O75_027460 [Burkholderia cepacia]|uniref:hypothetical protein n=1 Tax=Burkholderia cepacia TaxID=292 RepID=UPI0011B0871F|nr:hypothetical protein [Burkholderia cepacia]KAB1588609.1 hypothetical protein C5O75_027460 [Burkholderia cepacia]
MKSQSAVKNGVNGCAAAVAVSPPFAIRYTEDERTLLIGKEVNCREANKCGNSAVFILYFLIVWRIELKALWGKDSADYLRAGS